MSAFCAVIFLSLPCLADPLKAGIEFDHELAPLKSGLREGQRMNLGAVQNGGQLDITEWRRIPNWFAGTWHKENSTRFVEGRPVKYQTRADLITGYQKDAKGRIWQPVFVNVGKVETDDYIEYQMPQRKTIYAIEPGKYTSFSLSTRVRVDKDSGQIMSSFQQEDMSVSTPLEDGMVKAVVECRVFNQDGRVKFEDTIEVLEERTEEFNPIDEFNGVDYRASFIKFLEAKGHSELIPPDRPKSILTQSQEKILSSEACVNRMAKAGKPGIDEGDDGVREPRIEPRREPNFEPRSAPRFEPRSQPSFIPGSEPRSESRPAIRSQPRTDHDKFMEQW